MKKWNQKLKRTDAIHHDVHEAPLLSRHLQEITASQLLTSGKRIGNEE